MVCPAWRKEMVKANKKCPGTAIARRTLHVRLCMLVGENTIEHGLTQIPWSWSFFGNDPIPDDWKSNNFRLADIGKEKSGYFFAFYILLKSRLTFKWRYVEILLAWTATKFPPTPLKRGWNTAIPLNFVTALSRMSPPKLLMLIATNTGFHPEYNTKI